MTLSSMMPFTCTCSTFVSNYPVASFSSTLKGSLLLVGTNSIAALSLSSGCSGSAASSKMSSEVSIKTSATLSFFIFKYCSTILARFFGRAGSPSTLYHCTKCFKFVAVQSKGELPLATSASFTFCFSYWFSISFFCFFSDKTFLFFSCDFQIISNAKWPT
jgi:hypothetical protein